MKIVCSISMDIKCEQTGMIDGLYCLFQSLYILIIEHWGQLYIDKDIVYKRGEGEVQSKICKVEMNNV